MEYMEFCTIYNLKLSVTSGREEQVMLFVDGYKNAPGLHNIYFWLQSKLQERVKAGESKLREMELKLEGDRVKHAQVLAHEVAKVHTDYLILHFLVKILRGEFLRGHELIRTTISLHYLKKLF